MNFIYLLLHYRSLLLIYTSLYQYGVPLRHDRTVTEINSKANAKFRGDNVVTRIGKKNVV